MSTFLLLLAAAVLKMIPAPADNGGELAPNAFETFPEESDKSTTAKMTFIPMGAARCRLTVLPVYGEEGMLSYKWTKVPEKTIRANRPKIISQ